MKPEQWQIKMQFLDMMGQHIINKGQILILITFLLIGCNINTYVKSSSEDSYILVFNTKKKSFTEYLQYTKIKDTFYGNWEYREDTLFLNINSPEVFFSNKRDSSVQEYNKIKNDSIIFKVNDYANIFLNNEKINSLQTDTTGYLKIKKTLIDNFTVLTFSDKIIYNVKDSLSNYFLIETSKKTIENDFFRVDPTTKFLKKGKFLIPIINDSTMYDYKFKKVNKNKY